MSIFRDPDAPRTFPLALTLDRRKFLDVMVDRGAVASGPARDDELVDLGLQRPRAVFGFDTKVEFHDSRSEEEKRGWRGCARARLSRIPMAATVPGPERP